MSIDGRTPELREDPGGAHQRLHRLGKYTIKRRLGEGGMGAVFLAVDEELNRTVALKVLPRERAQNPTLVRRFKQEAQAAAQLEHKNIVQVYEAGEIEGFLYIALEYVDGIDVHELVVKRGVLPVKRSIDIVRQVAQALDHAASKQIVHRDIKPANLLIRRDGTVKLTDMGLARSIDETTETNITRAGMTVGTVDYMSPEQARSSQAADVRSDIYSLGCTWYHMLTGEPPYPSGGMTEKLQAHATGVRPDPRALNPAVPEALVAVLHRMMARNVADRYQTPQELLDDLELASTSISVLGSTMLDALEEESSGSARRRERTRTAGAAPMLPPKQPFKPVELSSGPSIDIDFVRLAIPATLVILLLGVLVWVMRSGGEVLSGGAATGGHPPQLVDGPVEGQDAALNAPAAAVAGNVDDDRSALDAPIARVSPKPLAPPPRVPVNFPGAEDAATTIEGLPLVPDWVNEFRQSRSEPANTITLTRRPEGANQFRRLHDALQALPGEGGTIKIIGDGPFVLEPAEIISRGDLRVVAADGSHPVIYLPEADLPGPNTGYLTVRAPQLEIDGCHFVMVDPHRSGLTLIKIERGDVSLRNCSITVAGDGNGESTAGVTALEIGGEGTQPVGGLPIPAAGGTSRCLLENVVCRGDRLTAVHLRGSASELVTGNCLLSSGAAPAIRLTDAGSPQPPAAGLEGRRLRLLATTLISGHSAVAFVHTGTAQTPVPCEVVVRKSVLAYSGSAGDLRERAMITFSGWTDSGSSLGSSRAAGVDWSTEHSNFLNWPALVQMATEAGAEPVIVDTANAWRRFWDKPLVNEAVVESMRPPPSWARPAALRPQDVSADVLARSEGWPADLAAGCRPDGLRGLPQGLIDHVLTASRVADDPDGIGERMAVGGPPLVVDVRRRSLDRFLESEECADGAHVIVTGSGLRKMGPVEIVDKSIRLEFQSIESAPLVIQIEPDNRSDERPPAAITVRNGAIDLVGARFKLPATSDARQPPWLLQLIDASVSLRGCTMEGPSTASEGHGGLISFADADTPAARGDRHILIEDSFLISPGQLLSGPVRWGSLILRNSILVTQSDLLTLNLDEVGLRQPSAALVSHCTLSAGQAVVRFVGQPLPTGEFSPLNLVVTESVFAGPVSGESTSAVVVARESESQTANHVRWWGRANGFAPTLGPYVRTEGVAQPAAGFQSLWAATWGRGHEAHPLFGPTDVVFAEGFPAWSRLEPRHFALNPTTLAAGWGADGTPIGALPDRVGAANASGSPLTPAPGHSPRPAPPGTSPRRNPF